MPKSTFYKLSDEKRNRVIEAAKKEFSENSFEDVSINRIIKNADIPRGSFYQYFEGKEDVFEYLIEEWLSDMLLLLKEDIKRFNGDLFACIEYYIDLIGSGKCSCKEDQIRILLADAHAFEIVWKSVIDKECDDTVSKDIIDYIDCTRLDVDNREELMQLLDILGIVIRNAMCKMMIGDREQSEVEIKQKLKCKIENLKKHYNK